MRIDDRLKGWQSKKTSAQILIEMATEYHNRRTASEEDIDYVRMSISKLQQRDEITDTQAKRIHELLKDVEIERNRGQEALEKIIGKNEQFLKMVGLIEKYAKVKGDERDVLLLGETGVGKELFAEAIFELSSRNMKPFIKVNCGGLNEPLVESLLFGHIKGAFTSATKAEPGFFKAADGGMIFLDEIGELSPNTQKKLLRALSERTFQPLGSTKEVKVDVVVIVASNKDLPEMIRGGKFRDDLFYRVNTLPIHIPPLRDRKDDISLLADHFLEFYKSKNGLGMLSFHDDTIKKLCSFSWPGNVRELKKVVNHAATIGNGRVILPADIVTNTTGFNSGSLDEFRKITVLETEIEKQQLKEIANTEEVAELKKQLAKEKKAHSNSLNKLQLLRKLCTGLKDNLTTEDAMDKSQDQSDIMRALIIKLVIEQSNGLTAKAWDDHSGEFIKFGFRKKGALFYQIRKHGLREKCKKARDQYYKKIINAKLLEKYRNNYILVAKALKAPRIEVCNFCKKFTESKR